MTVELTEPQINGRFKVVERPFALPGKCGVCGAVDKPCIDFGFDLDYYGAVYFCTDCIKEAATLVGMVEGEKLTTARLVQQDKQNQLDEAGAVINDYAQRFNDLHADFLNRLNGSSSDSVSETSEESEPEPSPDESSAEQESTGQDVLAGQSNRSTGNKRSSRVSKRASDESDTGAVFNF